MDQIVREYARVAFRTDRANDTDVWRRQCLQATHGLRCPTDAHKLRVVVDAVQVVGAVLIRRRLSQAHRGESHAMSSM